MKVKNMAGTLRVRSVVVDDVEPALQVTLPNDTTFILGREEALAFCFTSLRILRGMFANQEELNQAIEWAQARVAAVQGTPPS